MIFYSSDVIQETRFVEQVAIIFQYDFIHHTFMIIHHIHLNTLVVAQMKWNWPQSFIITTLIISISAYSISILQNCIIASSWSMKKNIKFTTSMFTDLQWIIFTSHHSLLPATVDSELFQVSHTRIVRSHTDIRKCVKTNEMNVWIVWAWIISSHPSHSFGKKPFSFFRDGIVPAPTNRTY